jgi:hypothetical protein
LHISSEKTVHLLSMHINFNHLQQIKRNINKENSIPSGDGFAMRKRTFLVYILLAGFLLRVTSAAVFTTTAQINVTDPTGVNVVTNGAMSCSFTTYEQAATSGTSCGTDSDTSGNRTKYTCTYSYAKNYTKQGNWNATVVFTHDSTNYNAYDASISTGLDDLATSPQVAYDCTAPATCKTDPLCRTGTNEKNTTTIYIINWDTTQGDCVGYGKLWYPSYTSGSNYYCCGDDGASDNFAYWSGTTCMYCNAGVNTSAGTNCTYPNTNCTATSTCRGGSEDYCCYNVGCTSSGSTVSSTNIVGGNCTCTDGLCYYPEGGGGICMNTSWGGSGCYDGTMCSTTGWTWTTYDAPPKQPTNSSTIPAFADPETVVNVTAVVEDYAPLRGDLQIWVDNNSASQPQHALCRGNSVANGSNSSCTFTASSAGCSAGKCSLKLTVFEVHYDICGYYKNSYPFYLLNFTYRDRTLSTPLLNAPTTDPNITVGNSSVLNCTPITGNASSGINMYFQFNSTSADWANISTSGGLITSQTNPVVNVVNGTAYAINVTGNSVGTYWVRCQVDNGTYLANSTAQQFTVKNISTQLNQSASPPSPQPVRTNITFSCNYSNSTGSSITGATVYVNIGGVDFSTTYNSSSGNYTYWNATLSGTKTWYCRASKTNYTPQTGSPQSYTMIGTLAFISTDAPSYPNCGGVFYRVKFYDQNSKLIDSYFSLKVIQPDLQTVSSNYSLYPNNGTGIFLGSYLLNISSQLGTWLLKVTENSGVTSGKNFYVR